MDFFTLPVKTCLHCVFTPAEVRKIIDICLVTACDGDGITPDLAFADELATRLITQLRENGLPIT